MIDSVMFWNEPNNKSHWDIYADPQWQIFARMTMLASAAVRRVNPRLRQVLGGISPIDPLFIANMRGQGVLDYVDVVAVHGFPFDWNHWSVEAWPERIAEIEAVTHLPVWVSEVGASTFGSEQVQTLGLHRMAKLLLGRVERVHWYSLMDLPSSWPATTRHREAEGSAYYRHFHMGLIDERGEPKQALSHFRRYVPQMGVCQWLHFEDHRLEAIVGWLRRLGVRQLRTGLSWADRMRPGALAWFDRQMAALEEFEVTVTFCFTPEDRGMEAHHTSPPREVGEFAEFCAEMVERYAPARRAEVVVVPEGVVAVRDGGVAGPGRRGVIS
jgi:beta-xylosidase